MGSMIERLGQTVFVLSFVAAMLLLFFGYVTRSHKLVDYAFISLAIALLLLVVGTLITIWL